MGVRETLAVVESLSRRTRKCMIRKKWRWGKEYFYRPRSNLVRRISLEFNCSESEALSLLDDARKFVLKNPQYY